MQSNKIYQQFMEITFYNKKASNEKAFVIKHPTLKAKKSNNIVQFKGLTLREYFARFDKLADANSGRSQEKDTASFEGLPLEQATTSVKEDGRVEDEVRVRRPTEISEELLRSRRREEMNGDMKLYRKQDKMSGLYKVVVPQSMMPTCRASSSQFRINNSIGLLSKLRKHKPTPRLHCSHLPAGSPSPSPLNLRQAAQLDSTKPRRKVFSYHYPQMHGCIKMKHPKPAEILEKLGSTPDLKGSFVACLKAASRR